MTKPTFNPGQKVEDYVIEKQIGKGGMAEIFLAEDHALKRKVVIKTIKSRYSERAHFKKQFLREARIQANLDNPHIVQILRMFNHLDNLCIVMPLIRGTDLARVIRKAKAIRKGLFIFSCRSWKGLDLPTNIRSYTGILSPLTSSWISREEPRLPILALLLSLATERTKREKCHLSARLSICHQSRYWRKTWTPDPISIPLA